MNEPDRMPEFANLLEALRDLPAPAFRQKLREELMQAAREQMRGTRPGHPSLMPYLVVQGAERLIEFMRQAFGAELALRVDHPDGSLLHSELRIGDSIVELGEAGGPYPPMPTALHLYVPDADTVYGRALEAGATSLQAPVDQEYGDREAAVRDASGNHWCIATHQGESHVPAGSRAVTPYLHPRGTAPYIEFLKRAFGAEVAQRAESPDGAVVHAKLRFGDSVLEMGEPHGVWQPMPATLHLYVPDADAVYRRALDAGAVSLREPVDEPYGDHVAGVIDPAGNHWYIATHLGN